MGKKIDKVLSWGITKYLRELSVVMIGVFVTLWVTSVISGNSKQNEVDRVMKLVQTELEDNLRRVEWSQGKWAAEQQAYQLIRQHISHVEEIPLDTLEKYRKVIGDIHSLSVNSDSYEVLKSSLLTQYIENKDFLRGLSQTYGSLGLVRNKLDRYTSLKTDGLNHIMNNVDQKSLDKWMTGDGYSYFKIPLEDNVFRTFVYTGGSIISAGDFETCKQDLASMIDCIAKRQY